VVAHPMVAVPVGIMAVDQAMETTVAVQTGIILLLMVAVPVDIILHLAAAQIIIPHPAAAHPMVAVPVGTMAVDQAMETTVVVPVMDIPVGTMAVVPVDIILLLQTVNQAADQVTDIPVGIMDIPVGTTAVVPVMDIRADIMVAVLLVM